MGEEFTHILDSLGWAVLHSIWQGGLAFLAVVIWRFVLRGESPALRHAGQITALIACFGAFVWTFAAYLGQSKFGVESGATLSLTTAEDAPRLLTGLISPFDPSVQAAANLSRITPILACLWAFGFAAMSLRYAFAFGQVQQLRTLGIQPPPEAWTRRFKQLAEQSGVSSRVKLYISANVPGPLTLGLLKPVVLVPIGFLASLPSDQVEAILRHELAHIRRYDYALNLIQSGVKTVLFFHPAIHIICRWADQDREQACDDMAVREGHNPLTLARGLAALRLQSSPSLTLAATGTGKDMPLMDRLTRLAGQSPKRGRPEHILMSVMSALLLGSVYLGSTSQAEAHPVPPALPDTIVHGGSVSPAAPVPPAPPSLPALNPAKLQNGEAMQIFIESDKIAYEAFVKNMESYAKDLNVFLERSHLDEDEREDLSDDYVDLLDDISDVFEDRREEIEELYEEHIEKHLEATQFQTEHLAEIKGLEAAMKGLEKAERELEGQTRSAVTKAKQKALLHAKKSIAKAKSDAKMAYSQAEIARSVAEANAWANAEAWKNSEHQKHNTQIDRPSREKHEAFRDTVMQELLNDGLIQSAKEAVFLSHPNNVMSLNGSPIKKGLRGKYCKLLDDHGFNDNNSEITIKPDSLTIFTDWKDGRHTTRVTYGTHTSH